MQRLFGKLGGRKKLIRRCRRPPESKSCSSRIICDHEFPIVRIDDASKDFNQALAGIACRPSPHYVVLGLTRVGFSYVYAPLTPPVHEDFRFEWKNNLDCARDSHNLRCMFVASRKPIG